MSQMPAMRPEQALVLACARVDLEADARQRILQLLGVDLDWTYLLAYAQRQGVLPLLYRHLQASGAKDVASIAAWSKLEGSCRALTLLVVRQRFETARLLGALEDRGLSVIALKGLHLRETIYPEPALRPSMDVDLLVRSSDIPLVETILAGLRYTPLESEHPRDWYRPDVIHHLVPYHLPGHGMTVEVHWDLMPPDDRMARTSGHRFDVDLDGLWERAESAVLLGRRVAVLGPADLVLHLGLHVAGNHRFTMGLCQLVDLAETVRYHTSRLDRMARTSGHWSEVTTRARAWRASRHLFLALRLARDLLDAPVPDDALQELNQEAAGERLVTFARERLLAVSAIEDRLSVQARQAPHAEQRSGHLGMLWAGIFPSRARMARLYGLQPNSLRLYLCYLARPFVLLRQYRGLLGRALRDRQGSQSELERLAREMLLDEWLDVPVARSAGHSIRRQTASD